MQLCMFKFQFRWNDFIQQFLPFQVSFRHHSQEYQWMVAKTDTEEKKIVE